MVEKHSEKSTKESCICGMLGALENFILRQRPHPDSSKIISCLCLVLTFFEAIVITCLLLPVVLIMVFCQICMLAWRNYRSSTQGGVRECSSILSCSIEYSNLGSNRGSDNKVGAVTGDGSLPRLVSRRDSDNAVGAVTCGSSSPRLVGSRRNSDSAVGAVAGDSLSPRLIGGCWNSDSASRCSSR